MAARCRQCRALLEWVDAGELCGGHADLRVELHGLRVLGCGTPGHPPEPPYADFAADLAARAAAGQVAPATAERGWLRRRAVCGACGGAVGDPEPGSLRSRVRLAGASPFTLSVVGPLVRCTGCGLGQLGPGGCAALAEACLDALSAGGLVLTAVEAP